MQDNPKADIAWEYLYFAISVVVGVVGLALYAFGELYRIQILQGVASVLIATGIIAAILERTIQKRFELVSESYYIKIGKKVEDLLNEFRREEFILEKVKRSGLTNLVSSRKAHEGSISQYISRARYSLIMTGVTLTTAIDYEMIQRTFLELLDRNVKITISLLDPKCKSCLEEIGSIMNKTSEELAFTIENNLRELKKFKDNLPKEKQGFLALKIHSILPIGSSILIDVDANMPNGVIQIETKPYMTGIGENFALEFSGSNSLKEETSIYNTLRKSWLSWLNDSKVCKEFL